MKLAPVMELPTVSSRKPKDDDQLFPVKHYSYSRFVRFCTNPIMFKIQDLNGDRFDTATSASAVMGSAFHKAMEVYYGGVDELPITNESEAIEYGLKAGMEYIEMYNDGFINWQSTIPNKQKMYDLLSFTFNSYVMQMPYGADQNISVEEKLDELVSAEWRGKALHLPVRLLGYADRIFREDGKLKIKDYKTVHSFSNPDKIDGGKILQAVFYYFLVFAKYGEMPYSMVYDEVKRSKNRDGSPQVRSYEVVFAENEQFFDFFFRLYDDITRALTGEMVYVPNIMAMWDNEVAMVSYIHRLDVPEELADQMKAAKVENITDLLTKKLQSTANMDRLLKTIEKQFTSAKQLNYEKMTMEEKIKMKLMEYGMMLDYGGDCKVEGSNIDLYRFTPSIGLKMSKLSAYTADIEQVLGVAGVRILAPIPGTSLVGFEVPKKNRTFPGLPKGAKGFEVSIGLDVMGDTFKFDLRESPHTLIAGATGSGKSVCLASLITQLNRMPKKAVELHLYDPKIVELAMFKDDKNVVEYSADIMDIHNGLRLLIVEMNKRYDIMAEQKVRDVKDTNLPTKFVFIDEFGDLILQEYVHRETKTTGHVYLSGPRKGEEKTVEVKEEISKEIAKMILQLAQKSRAAGIHMVIATQRPSVDIVTGSIKANFPTKIAFRTAKAIDSQVVLDTDGAEALTGKGDLIFSSQNGDIRLQGFNLD